VVEEDEDDTEAEVDEVDDGADDEDEVDEDDSLWTSLVAALPFNENLMPSAMPPFFSGTACAEEEAEEESDSGAGCSDVEVG